MREFINGAEAIARGAIRAGCNFFAGYPITPATPILMHMTRELPKVGGTAIQAEDEIAAMGFCIGAVLSGARAMTATSGPGISLYSENIGAAIMTETPMVIIDCQRMGPATGGATTTAQGDIQFLRWGTSGGYPVIVLSPTNVAECYTLIQRAFDLSERFRTPVFLVTDKETVLNSVTVDVDSLHDVPVIARKLHPPDDAFIPDRLTNASQTPPISHFGGPHIIRFTTSSYDERGYLTKNARAMDRLNTHLAAKIDDFADEIAMVKADLQESAEYLVVSYGITACSMIEAVRVARNRGVHVSSLIIYSLWPVPENFIKIALEGVKDIVVAELNHGQYRREIERLAKAGQKIHGVHRVDGKLITPHAILAELGL